MPADTPRRRGAEAWPPIALEVPTRRHADAFVAAVRRSRALHHPWIAPPSTRAAYRAYLDRISGDTHEGFLAVTPEGELAGYVNINEIVRGAFKSGYLGYAAFMPLQGRGHLSAALARVLGRSFRHLGLHRLEANIQPNNEPSRTLVARLGFTCEGFSRGYLKVAGRWRDHERWAITAEDWRRRVR